MIAKMTIAILKTVRVLYIVCNVEIIRCNKDDKQQICYDNATAPN